MPPRGAKDARVRFDDRLDRVLADLFPSLSRRAARDAVARGSVFVDGKRCRTSSQRVCAGTRIRLFEPEAAPNHQREGALPEEVDRGIEAPAEGALGARVLEQDADLLVLDKPPGVTVNESETVRSPSLADRARWLTPHVVHRLDRDTSGVLVLARHAEAARALSRAFAERRTTKIYWALVTGQPEPGIERGGIGADPRRPRYRRVRPDGKPAETRFMVRGAEGPLTWIEARPITGRTHQIRVHLAHRRSPVFGDLAYGGVDRVRTERGILVASRTALHARRLEIEFEGRVRAWEAPWPADLQALLSLEGEGVEASEGFTSPTEGSQSRPD